MIAIRHMKASELARIGEIDRSEHVTQEYSYKRGSLERRAVDVMVQTWSQSGDHEESVQGRINAWQPILDGGGMLVGAFDDDALTGVAIYRPHLAEDMACLSVLYVSRNYRRKGIGSLLAGGDGRSPGAHGRRPPPLCLGYSQRSDSGVLPEPRVRSD